jgi:hypothetical protein
MKTKQAIAGLFLTFGIAAMTAGSGIALAETNSGENLLQAHAKGTTLEVHISDAGNVLVRGAKVVSVNGSTVNASTTWNNVTLSWAVMTNSSTNLVQRAGKNTGIGTIAAGDIISFNGAIASGTAGLFSVNAKTVKDWTLAASEKSQSTVQGKVKTAATGAIPTSFVLTVNAKDYTVRVTSATSIMNILRRAADLSKIKAGDTVRVYGTVNTDMTIDASVVRDISIR